jgi:hypothetical protein
MSVFLGLCSTLSAQAQSPLVPATVTIQRYDELVNASGNAGLLCCAPEVLVSGPGADFYHVRMVFDVGFSDTLDRVSIGSNDIGLRLPGAEETLRAIGRYDHVAVFEDGAPSLFVRRPRDWPNETEQGFLDAVWIVPDGITSATLEIGPEDARLAIPLDLAVAPGQPVSPRQTLQVAVTGFGAESRLDLSGRLSNQDVTSRVVAGAGQALRLDLSVTPLIGNATDAQAGENRFFMEMEQFALTGPDGMPMPYLGTAVNNGLRQRWSVSSSWDNAPRVSEISLYYLGVPQPGTYTVYFLQDPVAQFNLE